MGEEIFKSSLIGEGVNLRERLEECFRLIISVYCDIKFAGNNRGLECPFPGSDHPNCVEINCKHLASDHASLRELVDVKHTSHNKHQIVTDGTFRTEKCLGNVHFMSSGNGHQRLEINRLES